MTYWVGVLSKCLGDSGKLPPSQFNQNHTKVGFLGFRVLNGGNDRKYLIKVPLFINLSSDINWAPSMCLDDW